MKKRLSCKECGKRIHKGKRAEFLEKIDLITPWQELMEMIRSHCNLEEESTGSPSWPLETMLKMYLLQKWFDFPDDALEERVYDSCSMEQFMGMDYSVDSVPDVTALKHFRCLLEARKLQEPLSERINQIIKEAGLSCPNRFKIVPLTPTIDSAMSNWKRRIEAGSINARKPKQELR